MKTNMINLKKITIRLLIFMFGIIFLLAWFSFILTPMAGDLKVFMASAKQASYISDNLIIGSFKAWELKSVYSRLVAYFIYKVAIVFAPYSSNKFEMVCKFIYSLFIVLVCLMSMVNIWGKDRKKAVKYAVITSIGFMAMHAGCQMQVEMTTSLLILLAFSLYINAIFSNQKTIKLYIAGLLIGTTFFFKSVLILLSVSVVAAVCIYKKRNNYTFSIKEMLIVVAGSLTMFLVTSLMIWYINPIEFRDIIDASAFQSTLISSTYPLKIILFNFGYTHIGQVRYIPIVMIGFLCFFINCVRNIIEKKYEVVVYHLLMWIMPALFILLSYKFFIYHFVVYIFPSIIEVYYFSVLLREFKNNYVHILFVVPFILWYLIQFSIFSPDVKKYRDLNRIAYSNTNAFLEKVNFENNKEMLYLDDGVGGYYLGNPSCLRYFFPLPLQRLPEDSEMPCHLESLEKAMEFEGKYISVYQSWFFGDGAKYITLKNKIDEEYEYIGSYSVFSPPHSLNAGDAYIREIDLYKRR